MLPRASRSAHVGNPKLEAWSQTDLLLFSEASTMPLERELAVYSENLMDLLTSEGKYVVVHGETIQGPFDTYEDALQAGYDEFGVVPFLVKRISRVEPIQYFSRDLPTCPS
jgi:hypothetical protein